MLINRLVTPVAGLVLLVFVGQRSGPLMGEYALMMTWYFVLQTLPLLGLAPFVMREAARHPARVPALFSTVGALAVTAGALSALCVQLALPALPYPADVARAVALIAWTAIPGILAFLIELLLIASEHARPVAYVACAENALRALISVAVVLRGGGVYPLAVVLMATRCSALLGYALLAPRVGRPLGVVVPELALWREIRAVLPVFAAQTALSLALSRLDFFMLSFYAGRVSLEQLGHYAVAYRLYEVGMLVVVSVCTSLFPGLASEFALSLEAFVARARQGGRALVTLAVPMALLVLAGAALYVRLFFPRQDPAAVALSQLFALALLPAALDTFLSTVLNAGNRQGADLFALACGGVVYVLALALLIPVWGLYGAWLACVIASTVQLASRFVQLRRARIRLVEGRRALWGAAWVLAALGATWLLVRGMALWSAPVLAVGLAFAFPRARQQLRAQQAAKVALPLVVLLSSCTPSLPEQSTLVSLRKTRNGSIETVRNVIKEEIPVADVNQAQPFRIRPDDVLKLFVLGYPEMTHVGKVLPSGQISLPMIGDLDVAGKTVAEVEPIMRERLAPQPISGEPLHLQRDDAVKMFIWGYPELTHVSVVQPDGRVVFPVVGEIPADGKTLEEIRAEVEHRLAARLNKPIVSVLSESFARRAIPPELTSLFIQEARPRHVVIFGEVAQPGAVELAGEMRVLDVLGRAQPLRSAQTNSVLVIRVISPEKTQYLVCRLADYLASRSGTQNVHLRDGDIVVVPKSTIYKVRDFVDSFFAITRSALDWYTSAVYAGYALDMAKSTVRFNNRIRSLPPTTATSGPSP